MFIIISSIENAFLVIVCVVKDILFLVSVTDSAPVTERIPVRRRMKCNMEGKLAPCVVRPRGLFSADDTKHVM